VHEDPTVEGLYETQVPLIFRALMDMGCVASVNRRPGGYRDQVLHHKQRPDRISLADIKFENTTACPYLSAKHVRMRTAYIYHSFSESDGGARGLIGVMTPMNSKKCTVWVYNRSGNAQRPPMARILKDTCSQDALEFVEGSEQREQLERLAEDGIEFTVEVAENRLDAMHEVSQTLKAFQDEAPTAPTVILKQSTLSAREISPILDDFAVLEVPAVPSDNEYEPLNWEMKAGTALARNLTHAERFYTYVLLYARYAHIPLCNISTNHGDFATVAADVLMGRVLQNNNHVLWASPGRRPDTGTTDQVLAFECDQLQNPDVNHPASYKSYCVTMQIQSLPVTAVVHAKDIDDVSHTSSGTDEFADMVSKQVASGVIPLAASLVDETTFCLEPFKILSHMVELWVNDAQRRGNIYADNLQVGSRSRTLTRISISEPHLSHLPWRMSHDVTLGTSAALATTLTLRGSHHHITTRGQTPQ